MKASVRVANVVRVRRAAVSIAAVAMLAMGVIAVTEGGLGNASTGSAPFATSHGGSEPTTTPPILAVRVPNKAPAWQGGGWPGMGTFHGGGWPGQ